MSTPDQSPSMLLIAKAQYTQRRSDSPPFGRAEKLQSGDQGTVTVCLNGRTCRLHADMIGRSERSLGDPALRSRRGV